MRPISGFVPIWNAVIVTFMMSSLMHDLTISIFYQEIYVLFTPWFGLMGLFVVLTEKFNISYADHPWPLRVLANSIFLGASYSIAYLALI
jgi:hypothetical protein